ncbi:MAG: DNA-3-methyladenine glycosylase I [Oceanospirillaceae bacterium]|nr:DNA-3-methyladenine glycosylase I [Oceanospirillaceae bacterium]
MNNTIVGKDGKTRCGWSASAPDFLHYHDHEWGFPVDDDTRLFEKICLESFQSGLSWRTILTKRDNFRRAFADFDFYKVATFDQVDVQRLMQDAGIVRNKRKIAATINNAKRAIEMVEQEGSLAAFLWRYRTLPEQECAAQSQTTSAPSHALAKALKKRGWQFVGPTTAFAFMQAMGLLNDHLPDCFIHAEIESARQKFSIPE